MAGKSDDVRAAITLAEDCVAAVDAAGERLTRRLDAGWRGSMLDALRVLKGEAPTSTGPTRRNLDDATKLERRAGTSTADLIRTLRRTMNESRVSPAVLRAWGSGMAVRADNNKSIGAWVEKVASRARTHPAELAALGLEQADIENLVESAGLVRSADAEQGTKKRDATTATASENAAIRTIYRGVAHASSRGVLEFRPNPRRGADRPADAEQVALFEGLYERATPPTSRAKKAKKPK